MSEILLFSDLHINSHKQQHQRLLDCLKVLEWVFNTARKNKIKDVVFLGDLFQDRQKLQTFAYHSTYQIISKYPDLNIYLLLGNHDLWFFEKTDVSSIYPLGGLAHVEVIGKPCTKNIAGLDIDFLPFTHNPIESIENNFKKKSPVLCAHIAVDGATLNFHHRTKSEVSIEFENDMVAVGLNIFDGWKRVFLGHYHGAQKLNDVVEYIGSTLQLNFNEAFQEKHVCILDTDDFTTEYVENTFSPKHIITTPDQVNEYQLENNFIRIDVEELQSTNILNLKNNLSTKGAATLEFRECKQVGQMQETDKIKFNLAEGDTLERYVETVGCEGLDKKFLLELGKDICLNS